MYTHEPDDIPPEMTSDNTMDARKTSINIYNLFSSLTGQDSLVIKQITSDTNGLSVNFPDIQYKQKQPGILSTEILPGL